MLWNDFRLLSDPNELERYLIAAGYGDILGSAQSTPTPTANDNFNYHDEQQLKESIGNRPPILPPTDLDLPETERFIVELKKDSNGLGITIAGYVCEKEELSGIFVKSVSAGSAADLSGRIQVNDRIIEVDQQSLQGYSNHQAVEVLKRSGATVSLCLERYLRGPKYEQLQQAIAANELKPSTPSGSGTIFPGTVRAHSSMSSEKITGSTELVRRPSLTSSYTLGGSGNLNDAQAIKSADSVLIVASKEKTIGDQTSSVGVVSARKLMNARDSIENRIVKEAAESDVSEDKLMGSENGKIDLISVASSSVTPDKPKYWVESVLTKEIENTITNKWQSVLGAHLKIIVAQIRKFAVSSGLGISLEGTVDVEGGREVRPHHYIRSILPEGPVGQNGLLRSGDELLGKYINRNHKSFKQHLSKRNNKNVFLFLVFV